MNLSAIIFLLLAISNSIFHRKYRWVLWAGFVLSVVLIILTTSKTALVVFLTLTIILPLYRALRGNSTQVVPSMIALVLVGGSAATLLLDNLPVIASALGKDLTLTGRTDIWAVMLELISERPLFGYGFNAFWQGWEHEITAYIWRTLEWECPYGHNGFMDLLAELGVSGLTVFFLSYVTACIRAIMWLRMTKTVEGLLPLMYLTFLFMYNITESSLLITNSMLWILYVSIIFSMALESEQAKKYSYASAMVEE
jgi:O-antigen ligase